MPPVDRSLAALLAAVAEASGTGFSFSSASRNQPTWRVRGVSLREALSTPYTLQVELATDTQAPAAAMLGKDGTLEWERDGFTRHVHGICAE